MTDDELADAVDGLFVHDSGQTNGIRDELLRVRVREVLRADLASGGSRLNAIARQYLAPPYGIEDVAAFIRWLDHYMDISV